MNKYLLLSVTAGICLLPHTAQALSTRPISTEQLQGIRGQIVSLKLSPGYGLVINFLPVGETIVKAWLDDPSRIALSFDGELCQDGASCTNTGANVIHLKQIQPLDLPYITHSPTGETLLTLLAEGAQGRKLYQFTIIPTNSAPEYTAINIVPETEYAPLVVGNNNSHHQPKQPLPTVKLNPRLKRSQQLNNNNLAEDSNQKINPAHHPDLPSNREEKVPQSLLFPTKIDFQLKDNTILRVWKEPTLPEQNSSSSSQPNYKHPTSKNKPNSVPVKQAVSRRIGAMPGDTELSSAPFRLANDLVYGLLIATQKGEIEYHSNTYLKIQNLILLLRRGQTLEASTSQALVKRKLVNRLLDWGQARPSSY